MYTSFYLKLEAQPGAHITTALADAKRIAQILNLTVEFDFNSVKCLINPDTDLKRAEENWNEKLNSKNTPKIISG